MSVTQWPLEAVALEQDGRPWYPCTPPGGGLVFLADPVLTIPGAIWSGIPPEYQDRPHVTLDEIGVSELLYFDPGQVTEWRSETLMERLVAVLIRVGSDARTLAIWLSNEHTDHLYGLHDNPRMQICRAFIHSLLAPGEAAR